MMTPDPVRLILLCATLLLVGGCASSDVNEWPTTVPQPQVFVDAWRADLPNQELQSQAEYLEWIRIFYSGNLFYPRGWLDIQSELLKRAEPQERPGMRAELERLGIDIGIEWAKLKDDRLVDSRLLALWGSVLQLAQIDQLELEAVDLIAGDVERLYLGDLNRDEIVESRYTDHLSLESFGDF